MYHSTLKYEPMQYICPRGNIGIKYEIYGILCNIIQTNFIWDTYRNLDPKGLIIWYLGMVRHLSSVGQERGSSDNGRKYIYGGSSVRSNSDYLMQTSVPSVKPHIYPPDNTNVCYYSSRERLCIDKGNNDLPWAPIWHKCQVYVGINSQLVKRSFMVFPIW